MVYRVYLAAPTKDIGRHEILENGRNSHFDPELLDALRSIARELSDEYSEQDSDKPRMRLEAISQQYCKTDIADLMS